MSLNDCLTGSVEIVDPPLILFRTRTNQELGASSVEVADDGTVVFHGVSKLVTENMLSSYPRAILGKWTPNRAAIRFPKEEVAARRVRLFDSGRDLDLDAVLALAD